MTDDLPFPVKASAEGKVGYEVKKTEITVRTDHKNFARFTNKIETVGRVFPKTYVAICDGAGNIKLVRADGRPQQFQELIDVLERLSDLYKKEALSRKEYENLRKTIIREMENVF